MNALEKFLMFCGIVALLLLIVVGSTLFNAWIIMCLWTWFLLPIFGIATPSLAGCAGLAVLVAFMTIPYKKDELDGMSGGEKVNYFLNAALFRPLMTLFVGWVIHLFM